jgi:isopentenyl phosphate kinase
MCGQGDVNLIMNWKETHSIEDLKRIAEENNYSAFTVSDGTPSFGHAAFKKFDYKLTKEHCKSMTTCCNHPCMIYIYNNPN